MTFQISHLNKAIICLTMIAACLLQVQADFFETALYAGLRINLADFLLPVAGILIMASLYLKQSDWPIYKIPNIYLWFVGMTAILAFGVYNGAVHQGMIPAWGLYNKFFGWFVLLAYFLWGAWFAYNGKSIKIYKFFRIFVIFALVVGTIGSFIITLQDFHVLDGLIIYPLRGIMANRNAFGFMFLCLSILMYFYGQTSKPLLGPRAEKLFWFMIPLLHVQIGSRSCWILLILQIAAFLFINRAYFIKNIIRPFAFGCVIIGALSFFHTNFVFKQHQDIQFVQLPELVRVFTGKEVSANPYAGYQSDMLRLKVNSLALELWAQSPILGTGLGTTQFEEPAKFGKFLDVIDSTPIWILTETGLMGAIVFAAFFWLILFYLSRELKTPNKYIWTINSSALGMFLTFAIMSVMHELLYTRFLWFVLGIAVTIPAAALRMHQASTDQPTN